MDTEAGDIMLAGIDHYTLRCRPDEIEPLTEFYGAILNLHPGPRPDFSFPGKWLYLGAVPTVHIAGTLPDDAPAAQPGQTGRFDHLSFAARDVAAVQAHLTANGIAYRGSDVPGFPLYQLFFHDPVGVKVELTFQTGV